jgi:hypothetical protein
MRIGVRHLVFAFLVASALIVAVGVFTFAQPAYHPRHEAYYAPGMVTRTFARHGVTLRAVNGPGGFQLFLRPGDKGDVASLQVLLAPRRGRGRGSWGPKLEPYDVRFGNVYVTYGGNDHALLERVQAAVSDIRNRS